ncbi:5-formyltetrahydrofolate cyclo-ligase [Anaerovibrio sp. JC8]|uniref:5-formyltetrahydrofolate cyclo-ligase n=1 Tax=Anaerovibrio sp. JC8 TaxID=1240085 RepID=UPI001301F77E|nr:5-formyltetrahydrofolate cyclo-ligase [Anaerovibrio sp. JC8]
MLLKKELRRNALAKRRAMSHEQRDAESHCIAELLKDFELYKKASCVFCYVSLEDEVHTTEIMEQVLRDGKKLCIPYIAEPQSRIMTAARVRALSELTPGAFDILSVSEESYQEVSPQEIDFVVVPGTAFDRKGHRIGMGGGYYDIFLEKIPKAALVAVAYESQVLEEIKVMDHDIPVDYLLLHNGIIKCSE